jgi:hypothetical protein
LCSACAALIDSDDERFPADFLRAWKADAEESARRHIGVPIPTDTDAYQAGMQRLSFLLDSLYETAEERQRASLERDWRPLLAPQYDEDQLKAVVQDVIPRLAAKPIVARSLRDLMAHLREGNSLASLVPSYYPPDETEIERLQYRTRHAARQIKLHVDGLRIAIAPSRV